MSAAAKGLVAGAATFCHRNGADICASSEQRGIHPPDVSTILLVRMEKVKWILVIEKEATFRSITESPLWDTIVSQGIIITGKGYPDLATRSLLCFLSSPSARNGFCSPAVYGFADFDPDGIAILSTFRNGSRKLAHEGTAVCTPHLQWLGLHSDTLRQASLDPRTSQALLPLSARDRKKAMHMLEHEVFDQQSDEPSSSLELQIMLMLNMKAELQILDSAPEGMTSLLSSALNVWTS